MQAQKAASFRRAVAAQATQHIWYLLELPPPEVAGLMTLAAVLPGQAELSHLDSAFHGFLACHEADILAPASASGHATDDGQVEDCLLD